MKAFDYFVPATLPEALAILGEHGDKAKILAGGTDLLVDMKRGAASLSYVVDLKRIAQLRIIECEAGGTLLLGALTGLAELAGSEILRSDYAAISAAAASVGSPQTRNRATLGGNLCNAAPSADLAPPLIALDAQLVILSPKGQRTVPIEQFFTGPKATILAPDEVLTTVAIPRPPAASVYLKQATRRADIAVVGVAGALFAGERFSLAMGAVAPTPVRAAKAEALLHGKAVTGKTIEDAAAAAAEESSPISDVRASAWYRRQIVKALTARVLRELTRGRPT